MGTCNEFPAMNGKVVTFVACFCVLFDRNKNISQNAFIPIFSSCLDTNLEFSHNLRESKKPPFRRNSVFFNLFIVGLYNKLAKIK